MNKYWTYVRGKIDSKISWQQKNYLQCVFWLSLGGMSLFNLSSRNTSGANIFLSLQGIVGIFKSVFLTYELAKRESQAKLLKAGWDV